MLSVMRRVIDSVSFARTRRINKISFIALCARDCVGNILQDNRKLGYSGCEDIFATFIRFRCIRDMLVMLDLM